MTLGCHMMASRLLAALICRPFHGSFRIALIAIGFMTAPAVAWQDPQAEISSPQESAVLFLKNGDFVEGKFDVSESGEAIAWAAPMFRESIPFRLQGVDYVTFVPPRSATMEPTPTAPRPNQVANPFLLGLTQILDALPKAAPQNSTTPVKSSGARIELANDTVLFGHLISLTEETLTFDGPRHGKVEVARRWVREMDGIASDRSLVFDGSGNLDGWISAGNQASLEDWSLLNGKLKTDKQGANLLHVPQDEVPYLCEFELSGESHPDFQVVFGASTRLGRLSQGVSIERWGDSLVLVRQRENNTFQKVELKPFPSAAAKWTLSLDVYFDADKKHIVVFSQGKRLGELMADDAGEFDTNGILIRNRGDSLSVDSARMRHWVGPIQVPDIDPQHDLVVMTDGSWHAGVLTSAVRETNELSLVSPEGESRTFNLDQVDRIRLASRDDIAAGEVNTHVLYKDGGVVHGRLVGVDQRGVLLDWPFGDKQLVAGWLGIRDVRFDTETPPEEVGFKHGLVQNSKNRLHGRVVNNVSMDELKWEAVYTSTPVTFQSARTTVVTFEPSAHDVGVSRLFSELALTTGDTIPCDVLSIDSSTITIKLADGSVSEIPRKYFKAVRDLRAANWIYDGLDPGDKWYTSEKNDDHFSWKDGRLEFFGDVLFARQFDFPDRCAISFDIQWGRDANFVIGMGPDSVGHALDRPQNRGLTQEMLEKAAKEKPDDMIEVVLTRSGRTMTVNGTSRVAGIMAMLFRNNVRRIQQGNTSMTLDDNSVAHVDILVDRLAREYVVLGNGRELFRWRDPSPISGDFLVFGLGSAMNGPSQSKAVTKDGEPTATIFNFRISRWPGSLPEDEFERFLTRRMGAPPKSMTHAIRAANGDSLRGQLMMLQPDQVVFRSRLDTMTFPRDRIVEIISLTRSGEPVGDEEATEDDPEASDTAETEASESEANDAAADDNGAASSHIRVRIWGGTAITFNTLRANEDLIVGETPAAGRVAVPWSLVSAIEFGSRAILHTPFDRWVLKDPPPLPEPTSPGQAAESDWVGKPAPDFEIPLLAGESVALADLKGKPVVLDFWATWCGPCLASMPTMMEIASDYEGRVEFVAVNQQEQADEIQEFLDARLWQLRVGLDQDGALGRAFAVNAIPTMVVIDAEGIVKHVHVGASPNLKQELTQLLDDLLP